MRVSQTSVYNAVEISSTTGNTLRRMVQRSFHGALLPIKDNNWIKLKGNFDVTMNGNTTVKQLVVV